MPELEPKRVSEDTVDIVLDAMTRLGDFLVTPVKK